MCPAYPCARAKIASAAAAAGRPILALAEGTEAGRVVEEVGGEAVRADDADAIAAALTRLIEAGLEPPAPEALARYTYPRPAEQMADAVERAITTRSR